MTISLATLPGVKALRIFRAHLNLASLAFEEPGATFIAKLACGIHAALANTVITELPVKITTTAALILAFLFFLAVDGHLSLPRGETEAARLIQWIKVAITPRDEIQPLPTAKKRTFLRCGSAPSV